MIFATSNDRILYALNRDTGNELLRLTVGGTWISSPTVANISVYVGGRDGTLYAVRAADGTVQWRSAIVESADGGRLYTPTVAGAVVFVGSDSNRLFAFDVVTGELK